MTGEFGRFIEAHRKKIGMTLRGLATELGIAPAFMSDIEKGHRYPPNRDKLYALARLLHLNEEDTNYMFDLAALERDNTVSSDLSDYIMENETVRVALRMARDKNATDADWQEIIALLEESETEKNN